MTADDRYRKLLDIREKIQAAQERLNLKNNFHDAHRATARELSSRYELLQSQLEEEVKDIEEHGRRVSSLEKSVLDWINGMEFNL